MTRSAWVVSLPMLALLACAGGREISRPTRGASAPRSLDLGESSTSVAPAKGERESCGIHEPSAQEDPLVYEFAFCASPDAQWGPDFESGGKRCPSGMVSLDGGTLLISSAWDGVVQGTGEKRRMPAETIEVQSFCIDQTEVSWSMFGVDENPGSEDDGNSVLSFPKFPAVVSYEAAVEYCRGQGKRLPTRFEWRYAAGGQCGWQFPWGRMEKGEDEGVCWKRPPEAGPCEVGTSLGDVSPQGVRDLAGNWNEWVADYVEGELTNYAVMGCGYWTDILLGCPGRASISWEPGEPRAFRCATEITSSASISGDGPSANRKRISAIDGG